jgi:hypothetical protein
VEQNPASRKDAKARSETLKSVFFLSLRLCGFAALRLCGFAALRLCERETIPIPNDARVSPGETEARNGRESL